MRRLALAIPLLLPLAAFAWNAAGHRLVARIAWDHLTPEARTETIQLLRQHPDHERWLKRSGDDDADRKAFIEASTWPDEIRKDARFYTAGIDEPTPLQPGFPDMDRRRGWHAESRPLDGPWPQAPVSGQLGKQLAALPAVLGSRDKPTVDRAYALPWIIHMAAEAHQPLHTSLRIDAEGNQDKLGQNLKVIDPHNPHKMYVTLHAFWDNLPGPSSLRGEALEKAAQALVGRHARPARTVSTEQWIRESWEIARDGAYPESGEAMPVITDAFYENSQKIADRRIAEAGYRLADLLNSLFKPNKSARRPN